jgi:serralysin
MVAAHGVDWDYEEFGWKEGRDPSSSFDTLGYLAANPDVAAAHVNPLDHFMQNGIYEGRAVVSDWMWH